MFSMQRLLSAFFLWLTMITMSVSEPIDIMTDNFPFDKRVLGEDSQDLTNRTFGFKPNSGYIDDSTRTSHPALVTNFASTKKYPGQPLPSKEIDPGSHPNSRGSSYTPALPKDQFSSIFADKPTLRGSNTENSVPNRRPHTPPITVIKTEERVPIKRPDLVSLHDSKKKTINTPSVQKLPEGLNYSEPSSSPSSTTTHVMNNTLDVVGAAVHNISHTNILRILDNGNNKHDFITNNNPLIEQELKTPKTHYTVVVPKPSPPPAPVHTIYEEEKHKDSAPVFAYPSSNVEPHINRELILKEQVTLQNVMENKGFKPSVKSIPELSKVNLIPEHPEPRIRYILGIAWDIHVYLIAVMFAILVCMSVYSLVRISSSKWLLPHGYFLIVHGVLAATGTLRSFYLFYDAYNISKSFSEPLSRLMFNIVFPFLISIFTLMFLFIMKVVPLKVSFYYASKSGIFSSVIIVYVFLSVCIDLYADVIPHSSTMVLLSQCMFVFMCIVIGITYIIFYKYVTSSSLHRQNSIYSSACADPLRPSLAHAIRVMLAVSLLSLLMAVIQLIGIFCVFDPLKKEQPHPWLWWAFQLSVRVIEVSICFLVFWAAIQPLQGEREKETHSHNSASGFPLFPWGAGGTPRSSNHSNADDIYPAVCNTNLAINGYALQPSKEVYEDVFQYYNAPSHGVTAVPTHLLSRTTDRQPFKMHLLDIDGMKNTCATLNRHPERRLQPSPSMLIDDKGVIRFRSIADTQLCQEDTSHMHVSHTNDNYYSS